MPNYALLAANIDPPTWRSTSALRTNAVTLTNDPGKPAGTVNDDFLVAFIVINSTTDTIATPAGWTADANNPTTTTGGGAVRSYIFTARGSVATTQFTKTGTAGIWRTSISAFKACSGVHLSASNATSANSTVTGWPTLTSTIPNTLSVAFLGYSNGSTAVPPAGWTERAALTSGGLPSIEISTQTQYPAASTGALTGSIGTSGGQSRFHLLLRPAVAL